MTSHLSLDPDDLNFSVLPPNDLLSEWEDDILYSRENIDITLLKAYQAGADAELEACCEWLREDGLFETRIGHLRAARRPKPLSLKEQALQALALLKVDASTHGLGFDSFAIRRALESLPD